MFEAIEEMARYFITVQWVREFGVLLVVVIFCVVDKG